MPKINDLTVVFTVQSQVLKRTFTVSLILSVTLLIAILFSLLVGTTSVGFTDLWNLDFHRVNSNKVSTIIFSYRLPRILLACIAGAGLASSGVVFQGVLRNPLADPYIIGIAAGGALGAVTSISLLKSDWLLSTSIASFLGSLTAVGLV